MHVATDLEDRPMTHGLAERVRLLKREYHLLRGLDLTTDDALAELARIDGGVPTPRDIRPLPPEPVTEPFPYRRDIALAESKLIDMGYDDATVALIISDLRRCGSAWCVTHFHEAAEIEHTEIIEAILSDSPDWNRPEYSTGYVNLGLAAEPIADTF